MLKYFKARRMSSRAVCALLVILLAGVNASLQAHSNEKILGIAKRSSGLERDNVIEIVNVDLKNYATNKSGVSALINSHNQNVSGVVLSSRLYSNQLSAEATSKFFSIKNKTHLNFNEINFNRVNLCANLRFCERYTKTNAQKNRIVNINNFTTEQHECVLGLNFLFYIGSNSNGQVESNLLSAQPAHFNQIKFLRLNLLLNDFSVHNLKFDQESYSFYVVKTSLEPSAESDFTPIGTVRATNSFDSELNTLIRYFIGFKTDDRAQVSNMFRVDEQTGLLQINRKLTLSSYSSSYEFHVLAITQCSQRQKPLTTRTNISVRIYNDELKNRPSMNMTKLIKTKTLGEQPIECIKLDEEDLNGANQMNQSGQFNSIALVQIQVENANEAAFNLSINRITPARVGSLSIGEIQPNTSVRVQHLIDNIYIIYLLQSRSANYSQSFVTEIYEIGIQLNNTASVVKADLCLIIEAAKKTNLQDISFYDDMSLVQFNRSINRINLLPQSDVLIPLVARNLGSSRDDRASQLAFYLDSSTNREFLNYFVLSPSVGDEDRSNAATSRVNLVQTEPLERIMSPNNIQLLQIDLLASVFDSWLIKKAQFYSPLNSVESRSNGSIEGYKSIDRLPSAFLKSFYNNMSQHALESKKFLRFTSKVLINTDVDVLVQDEAVSDLDKTSKVAKFLVDSENLVENSVIGHLKNVFDVELEDLFDFITFDSNVNNNLQYHAAASKDEATFAKCFKLNKYDGVLSFVNKNRSNNTDCFSANFTRPVVINVSIRSSSFVKGLHYAQIWIYNLNSLKSLNQSAQQLESSAIKYPFEKTVNVVYDKALSGNLDKLNEMKIFNGHVNTRSIPIVYEFGLNFEINFNLNGVKRNNNSALFNDNLSYLPDNIKLANLVSKFEPTLQEKLEALIADYSGISTKMSSVSPNSLEHKTKFVLKQIEQRPLSDENNLFVLDSKKGAIYLNMSSSLSNRKLEFRCYQLHVIASNYIHVNSVLRKLHSADGILLNLCFKDSYGEISRLGNQKNVTSLVTPSLISNMADYQSLIRNANFGGWMYWLQPTWVSMIVVFGVACSVLILATGYLCMRYQGQRSLSSSSIASKASSSHGGFRSGNSTSSVDTSASNSYGARSTSYSKRGKQVNHATSGTSVQIYSSTSHSRSTIHSELTTRSFPISSSSSYEGDHTVSLKIRNDLSKHSSLNKMIKSTNCLNENEPTYCKIDKTNSLETNMDEHLDGNDELLKNISKIRNCSQSIFNLTTEAHLSHIIYPNNRRSEIVNVAQQTIELETESNNHSMELSSIKLDQELGDEQGAYCVATGTSFSVSSNFSSVTNSQCVDDDCLTTSRLSCEKSPTEAKVINYADSGDSLKYYTPYDVAEMTRLSLLEFTPTFVQGQETLSNIFHHLGNIDSTKINNNLKPSTGDYEHDKKLLMSQWLLSNYNINCNGRQEQNIISTELII